MQLRLINHRKAGLARYERFDLDLPADRALQKVLDLGQHSVEIGRDRLEMLSPRECQKLVGQAGSALCCLPHIGEPLHDLAVKAFVDQRSLQKPYIAQKNRQKIVEIVRHS